METTPDLAVDITIMPLESESTARRRMRRTRAHDPYIGRILSDRYRVLEKLGEGGMGAVYLAEHVLLERRVAIKILSKMMTQRADVAARFIIEARAASQIGHESIVGITDFDRCDDGAAYFVMEYLRGIDLGERIRASGTLSFAVVRGIVLQLCAALGAAHDQGVIHRDLKPQNVFLTTVGTRHDVVKLLDFGVAKVMRDGFDQHLTGAGVVVGTPAYLPPEYAQGHEVDARGDVYSLGCLMYEMLTGSVPFTAQNVVALVTMHAHQAPEPPTVRNPSAQIPRELEAIVLRALAKRPEDRYQSMSALADDLLALSTDLPSLRRLASVRTLAPPRPRRIAPIFVALALVAAAATATVTYVRHQRAITHASR